MLKALLLVAVVVLLVFQKPEAQTSAPLMVGGLLYMSTGFGTVAALNPATGSVVWFDPPAEGEVGAPNRGLAYWSAGNDQRIISLVGRYLVAVNAKTGKRYSDFGEGGRVDLVKGYRRPADGFRWNSPPLVVRDVIVGVAQAQGRAMAEHRQDASLQSFASTLEPWTRDDALRIEMREQTDDRLSFDVTRCRYAEMYRSLGIPELGAVLSCNRDAALIEGFNPKVSFVRTQTIMQGATHCDFRYRAAGC